MQKPFDDNARELDAFYSIEPLPGGFDLIVESRGGSDHGPNAARNSDYNLAMEQHLSRMGVLGVRLQEIQVASGVALKFSEANRKVNLDQFTLPLTLSAKTDVRELRLSIGRASAAFGRTDGSDRGNRTKRMRLRINWAGADAMSADEIERLLSRKILLVGTEEPTHVPDELQKRVRKAADHIRTAGKSGNVLPPLGQVSPARMNVTTTRFVRDPNVIAFVLEEAAGHCEVCGSAAPFSNVDGEPYLEVHHIRPLSEGGPDTTDNAAACCPNCHRRLHYDPARDRLRTAVINGSARLKDYPAVARATVST